MAFFTSFRTGFLISLAVTAAQYQNPNSGYQGQSGSYNNNNYQNQNQNQNGGSIEQFGRNAQNVYNDARAGISNVAGTIANTASNVYGAITNHTANATNALISNGVPPEESGVYIKVSLRAYQDNGYRLSPTTVCKCPDSADHTCVNNSPQKAGYACYFSFMVVIASADSFVRYDATPFVRVDNNYGINQDEINDFAKTFEFIAQSQPTAISVIVSHMGAVIDATTGAVNMTNTVVPVDLFTVAINETTQYGQPVQTTVVGSQLQTALQLQYTVQCRGSLIGPGCNLKCNTSSLNTQIAVCQEVDTGYFQTCKWINSNTVNGCTKCPWGIRDNSYCADENGGILDTAKAGVVSAGYKTATIVIGIIAAILFLLLLIVLVISMCIQRRNRPANSAADPPGTRRAVVNSGHFGNAESQPLNAAHSRPVPSPRNQPPPLQSLPPKSALRTPTYQYPPSAHLGGTDSLNDTLNSSFAGSQIHNANVSRSADV